MIELDQPITREERYVLASTRNPLIARKYYRFVVLEASANATVTHVKEALHALRKDFLHSMLLAGFTSSEVRQEIPYSEEAVHGLINELIQEERIKLVTKVRE